MPPGGPRRCDAGRPLRVSARRRKDDNAPAPPCRCARWRDPWAARAPRPPPRRGIRRGARRAAHAGRSHAHGSSSNGGSRKITSNSRRSAARNARASATCASTALAPSERRRRRERVDRGRGSDRPRPQAPRRATPLRATARRSRHRDRGSGGPARSCPSQLNSVSRTRSGVGRSPATAGKRTTRPRKAPPMMRTRFADGQAGRSRGEAGKIIGGDRAVKSCRGAVAFAAYPPALRRPPMFDLFKRKTDDGGPAGHGASGSRQGSRARARSSAARSHWRFAAARSTTRRSRRLETALIDRGRRHRRDRARSRRSRARAGSASGGEGDPKDDAQGGRSSSFSRRSKSRSSSARRAPVRDHAGRRQRRRKDDVDRQAREAPADAGPFGAARRGRHVSRRRARAARGLGRAQWRHRDLAAGRRRRRP